jgi:large subunit ribosomal protein L9
MEVILLKQIRKLGRLGSRVKVSGGFGRNFLIPQGHALPANEANIARFETLKAELEVKSLQEKQQAEARKAEIEALLITLSVKAGDEGKLFGSVGTRDIADAASKIGCAVDKSEVRLPNGAIRNVGSYDVSIQLDSEISAVLKLVVAGA